MRTTIEIKPEHRQKLLELAAQRGEKGLSSLIAEALDLYFRTISGKERSPRQALRLRGVLSQEQAERLRREVTALREAWR